MTAQANYVNLADKSFALTDRTQGGAGSVCNEYLRSCKICTKNGFPHEPIIFKPLLGLILSDGSIKVIRWAVCDYFRPWQYHKHKRTLCSSTIKEVMG